MEENRCGVFGVGSHLVAIHASVLQEMFVLPEVRRPPGCAPHQRGLVDLRGTVLPAFDLRVSLGLESAQAEMEALVELLRQREQDHRNWLDELGRSVAERRPFGLATDPRKCRFGQWYYSFRTEDPVLRGELVRFEEPHAQIHALALEVEKLKASGGFEEAQRQVEGTRHGLLSELLERFARLRDTVREQHKEIGVCARLDGRAAVFIVDRAEAVAELEPFPREDDPVAAGVLQAGFVRSLARWKGAKQPVLVLDLARLDARAQARGRPAA